MRKRLILATVAVAVIACVVLGALAMLPQRPGVTKANFDRIEKGMTEAEVNGIFGTGPSKGGGSDRGSWGIWFREDGAIATIMFRGDSVDDMFWTDSREPFTDKFRRWLHLL